jgi:hypothetical protein
MNRSSSNEELIREIAQLAKSEGLEMTKALATNWGTSYALGFKGCPSKGEKLAKRIQSETGQEFEERSTGSWRGDRAFVFPKILLPDENYRF